MPGSCRIILEILKNNIGFVMQFQMQHINHRLFSQLFVVFFLISNIADAAEMPRQVGTVSRIQGQALEQPQGFESRTLNTGSPVHARSKIKTGPNSRLEIRFTDGSKMTLGEWAYVSLKVNIKNYRPEKKQDEQVSEPASKNKNYNSMVINILSGTFRFITGLIAKIDNKSVNFGTQVATIGVRGTDFFGGPLAAGMPTGEVHYGFMILDGAIDVKNRHGEATLDAPYEGTFLPMKGHKAPTPPSVWKQKAIDEAFASISFN